jgi:sec-independent protein translocase protein TatB
VPFLSPAKILVILVVAVIVLGPDKLPKVARQVGGLWGDFRKFRERLESDVRGSFPDLPSTETITQAVRSPLTFLDSLADSHSAQNGSTSGAVDGSEPFGVTGDAVQPPATVNRPAGIVRVDEGTSGSTGEPPGDQAGALHRLRVSPRAVADDPNMN